MCSEPLRFWLKVAGQHIQFGRMSTACWRGYQGTWKVINDRLYLVDIQATDVAGNPMNIEDLFPGYSNGVFAHWFSGEIRCPQGKMLDYVHMGYGSTYEKDFFLTFSKGVLISQRQVINGEGKAFDSDGYGVAAYTTFPASK